MLDSLNQAGTGCPSLSRMHMPKNADIFSPKASVLAGGPGGSRPPPSGPAPKRGGPGGSPPGYHAHAKRAEPSTDCADWVVGGVRGWL